VQLKKEHPSWNLGIHTPAISTVHAVLVDTAS
jgi:hypothetical protein